ncbi:MAG: hypothetical protein PVH85_30770 [Desulfobacterales bacterium]|jgi:hypothetical protein
MKPEHSRKKRESSGEKYPIIPLEDKKDNHKITIENGKETLVFLVDRRKKRIDHTITTPDKYVSRYHFESKNLDQYLELCPHCRKPTMGAYQKTVANSALTYLETREEKKGRRTNRKLFVGLLAGGLVLSSALYYLLVHVLSGARF